MAGPRDYPDIRVVRTRTQLREALIDLLQDAGFESVNVADIARRAGVNRVTFYNHYSSKEELLAEVLDTQLDEYVSLIDKFDPKTQTEGFHSSHEQFIRLNYEHFDQYAKVYKILLSEEFPAYTKKFIEIMQQSIRHVLSHMKRKPGLEEEDYAFFSEWIIGGTMQTVRNWIRNGQFPSAEVIARRTVQTTKLMLL
ncbi:TetR/AcrR family transcriptional regulator [Cohnella sp. AR92]|uniref:TetR/AcrR family transcriptional regulator n=1 Tax=Cohnella sp. AR92 TaxID=648716 RepID=UPI000F8F46F3|nr:TetR/AcrR family transcriptional regulator [Cohnella sp. AR92]RUS46865.1 TetR/AcrR family transcriptional regulator [Cohnella sp. AR92]